MDCGIVSTNKDKIYNIAIIGAGQLGSRHLQGLAKSSKEFQVFVIDPNAKSLKVAEERFKKVSKLSESIASFHKNINDLPAKLDFAVIATTANVRRLVTENLLEQVNVRYIIFEKVVFQKSGDFLPVQNIFNKMGTKAWVNCTRRAYSLYKELSKELKEETLEIKVSGRNWGLACNSIHMIDLLVFLTGQTDLVCNNSNLNERIYPSKRDGYKELQGKFVISTGRGDILELLDRDSFPKGDLTITINLNNRKIIVNEARKILLSKIPNLKEEKEKIIIPLQSEITGQIVDQIIDTGDCDLVPYNECIQYHVPMLDAFNEHFSRVTGKDVVICPIT